VPLEPVLPFRDAQQFEERNSYEEDMPHNPYHPEGWKGKLPGPGLVSKDVLNTTMALGRLMSF